MLFQRFFHKERSAKEQGEGGQRIEHPGSAILSTVLPIVTTITARPLPSISCSAAVHPPLFLLSDKVLKMPGSSDPH